MKYLLLLLTLAWSAAAFGRNDFWLGHRYAVSLSFGAGDLGKMNAPTPKQVVPPEFPAAMIQAGIAGEVTVDYTVTSDGRVREIDIVQTSAEEFQQAVSAAVRAWIFNPAIELTEGKPVAVRMRCKVRFALNEEAEPAHLRQPTTPNRRGSP